jgi:hypothetical protein
MARCFIISYHPPVLQMHPQPIVLHCLSHHRLAGAVRGLCFIIILYLCPAWVLIDLLRLLIPCTIPIPNKVYKCSPSTQLEGGRDESNDGIGGNCQLIPYHAMPSNHQIKLSARNDSEKMKVLLFITLNPPGTYITVLHFLG